MVVWCIASNLLIWVFLIFLDYDEFSVFRLIKCSIGVICIFAFTKMNKKSLFGKWPVFNLKFGLNLRKILMTYISLMIVYKIYAIFLYGNVCRILNLISTRCRFDPEMQFCTSFSIFKVYVLLLLQTWIIACICWLIGSWESKSETRLEMIWNIWSKFTFWSWS